MTTKAIAKPYITPHNLLGEGPLYDKRNNTLYWVDINAHQIHSMELAETGEESWKAYKYLTISNSPYVTFLGLTKKPGILVCALEHDLGVVDTGVESGAEVEAKILKSGFIPKSFSGRLNEGVIDPRGRFFIGSMWESENEDDEQSVGQGELFRYDPATDTVTKLETGILITNGMGFNHNHTKYYMIDSPIRTMWEYDYDIETGDISNRKAFKTWPDDGSVPDGFSQSADGHMWVAFFFGSKVEHLDETGKLVETITLPASRITATAWAGKKMDQLFITSCSEYRYDAKKNAELAPTKTDKGGELFEITLPTVGASRFIYSGEV